MKLTNKLGLPEAIVRAVANDGYSKGGAKYSVTQLVSPARQSALIHKHWDEIEEDVSDRLFSLFGQVAHGILERADIADALTEERMTIDVDGISVSGQIDRMIYYQVDGIWKLSDYKNTSLWAVADGVKPEWTAQQNIYAEMLRQHSFDVDALEIVALFRDWSKARARRERGYPQQGAAVLPVPMWSSVDTMAYLRSRIAAHEAARSGALPDCTADERWARPDAWAVMKRGNKRAIRGGLKDTESAAVEMVNSIDPENKAHYVEHRRGMSARCADYCSAAPFCTQWILERTETEAAEAA